MRLGSAIAACLALLATPSLACSVQAGFESAVEEVVARTNDFRKGSGRRALASDAKLERAAQAHACHMARTGSFSHTGAGGSSADQRVESVGYRWRFVAENIAYEQPFAQGAVKGWENSPPHRKNMLSRNAREIGIGLAASRQGQLYWVMVLGASR